MSVFRALFRSVWCGIDLLPHSLVVSQKIDHITALEDALRLWKDLLDVVPEDVLLANGWVFIHINVDNSPGTWELLVLELERLTVLGHASLSYSCLEWWGERERELICFPTEISVYFLIFDYSWQCSFD